MKKYSTSFLFLSVFTILFVGNRLFQTPKLEAVEKTSTDVSREGKISSELVVESESTLGAQLASRKSEYTLPYPGILPTHPLYFLKEIRDRIIEMLIADPIRKSEFYLLQSDKWLSAGTSLLENGETQKAGEMFIKSGERMQLSITELSSLKAANRQIPGGSIDKLETAIYKHLEVLESVVQQSGSSDTALELIRVAQEELMKLKS